MGLFDSVSSTISDATAGLSDALGITVPKIGINGTGTGSPVDASAFKGKMQEIQRENWNKLFHYSFFLYNIQSNTRPGLGDINGFFDTDITLDIPPQNLAISTHFATNVTATNDGILEEHNGVVFRTITIAGTTGLWPNRPSQPTKAGQGVATKLITNIFPGAVTAIQGLANNVRNTVASVTGTNTNQKGVPRDDAGNILDITNTGYYRFWSLHNFFVGYAEMKKTSAGQGIVLVFSSPKDNVGYVCTPVSFDLRRDSSNPLLYRYNIVLKAWNLVATDQTSEINVLANLPTPDNVNAIKSITNTLMDARTVINSARNVLAGVNSDFVSIMNVYTQGVMVLKEAAGFAEDLNDFPSVIKNNAAILLTGANNSFVAALQSANSTDPQNATTAIPFTSTDEQESQFPSGSTSATIAANSTTGATGAASKTTPGGEDKTMGNARLNLATGALSAALDSPSFTATPLSSLDIPPSVQAQMDTVRTQARQTTSGQIRDLTADIKSISDNLAQSAGMMDPVYAQTYGLPAPVASGKVPTEDDILNEVALEDAQYAFIQTLATGEIFRERDSDPFVSANNNLQASDQMQSPGSQIPVPFPRGSTLENLALRYLGDASRAREIAILNNLRAPFIDEIGFSQTIATAEGRTFVVTDDSNLSISQAITIQGTGVAPTRRTILNIEAIGGGQYRVTVDGPDNLSIYLPSTNPTLTSRLPGTVGPGDIILIPDPAVPVNTVPTRPSPLFNRLSAAEKVFKIDLALDASGHDIDVGASGDIKRSYGYNNAVQAIQLGLETEKGELEDHPDYGLAVPVGQRNSDLNIADLNRLVKERITADPRFASAVTNASVDGSVVSVNIIAQGARGTGAIPVEFQIGKA